MDRGNDGRRASSSYKSRKHVSTMVVDKVAELAVDAIQYGVKVVDKSVKDVVKKHKNKVQVNPEA